LQKTRILKTFNNHKTGAGHKNRVMGRMRLADQHLDHGDLIILYQCNDNDVVRTLCDFFCLTLSYLGFDWDLM